MVRIHRVVLAFLLAGLAAMAAAETVYKWVDSSGQVHYTDLPPRQGDAKILSIYQRESGIADETESDNGDFTEEGGDAGTGPAAQTGAPTTPEPPVSEEAMAEAEADAAKAKVEMCKAAQDRYQRYIDSRRLFRETADGKRQYLTDQELTEARARAKQAVNDYCG
ncbi:MAG TPA: DUF4124 domain-containing protein [Steroidobacteraceae bacterium]